MRTGYIYVIINNVNGKYYFGKTFYIKGRWNKHIHLARKKVNRKLYDAMNYHGYENFSIHTINEYKAKDKTKLTKILNEREIHFIKLTNSQKWGYNMSKGGDGGYLGEEAIEKMARRKRGVPLTEEHKRKISEANKGKTKPSLSEEHKRKISRTNKIKGIKWKPQYWGKEGYNNHPMLGKHHSKKSKKQMSEWRSGKTFEEIHGEENAKKLKDIQRKKWIGEGNPNFVKIDIEKVIKLLKDYKPKEIAKILNISYPTLLYKFKTQTDKTFTQWKKEN